MSIDGDRHVIALSGGVGGAKLVHGLAELLSPEQLTVITNTGDDFEHLGLNICPDLDTVLYTLADWNNKELGWGQEGETWQFLEALQRLDGETWFKLGDRDLATHITRTQLLNSGHSLSEVVEILCNRMGIAHQIVPMTDDPVRTMVDTRSGETLAFQHYFVRDRCEPEVTGFNFSGIGTAKPAESFLSALQKDNAQLIVCPSNPFVSVDPILAIPGVIEAIRASGVSVTVVSNIVGGQAIKGPAAKMMRELGMPQTALGVAQHYVEKYDGLITNFVLDSADSELENDVQALGLATIVTNSVMVTLRDKTDLAQRILNEAGSPSQG